MSETATSQEPGLKAVVCSGLEPLLQDPQGWDALLARSAAPTIFLTSAWLRAWSETLGSGADLLSVQVYRQDQRVAMAAFERSDGELRLAGRGADYADLIIDDDLDDRCYAEALDLLLSQAAQASPECRSFRLVRVPAESRTVRVLNEPGSPLLPTIIARVGAPIMDMGGVDAHVSSKRMRQRERRFAREGQVDYAELRDADRVLAQLPEFFNLHIRRWQDTPTPSLFLDPAKRDFYCALVRHLGSAGLLRYGALRLDGTLAAAHLGFLYADRFYYYKTAYDTGLAKLSPGDVLLKRLMEQAASEGARWFDFTIGEEPYKLRYASEVPQILSLHLTRSRTGAYLRRARAMARAGLKHLREKGSTR